MKEILTRRNTGMGYMSKIEDVESQRLKTDSFIKTNNGIEWVVLFEKIILQTISISGPYDYFIYSRKYSLFGIAGKKEFNCFNEVVYSRDDENYPKLKERIETYKQLGAGL